ncbi:MAG: hypothetical protein Q3982_09640, partial [Phoenicibacter congonensis]|nr:hypothetical protein [Phoenicibacter congonensis]
MKSQKKNSFKIRGAKVFFVICFVAIALIMIFAVQSNVDHSMRTHQMQMVDMVTNRIAENMNSFFQAQWGNLEFVEKNLRSQTY